MVIISKSDVERIVSPHLEKIQQAVVNSVNSYYRMYIDLRSELSARSDASICHDRIINAVQELFSSVRGAGCIWRKGLFLLILDGIIAMRFKKFNRNLMGSGIETRQLQAFNLQEPEQLELPNMPPYGLLYVGYTLNPLRTRVEGVYITCRHGNKNVWVWDITPTNENRVIEIPQTAIPQLPQRRVTVRGQQYLGAAEQVDHESGS